MLSKEQSDAFEAFRELAKKNDLLSEREKLFVQFAAAVSMGCQP
jgi:hypothetical protein